MRRGALSERTATQFMLVYMYLRRSFAIVEGIMHRLESSVAYS